MSEVILNNLYTFNIQDYGKEVIDHIARHFTEEEIKKNFPDRVKCFVAVQNDKVVGTASMDNLKSMYGIKVEDETNKYLILTVFVDINKNEFSDDTIMYKLYNEDKEELIKGVFSGTGEKEIASNVILESEKEVDYTLVVWLKETGDNQNEEMRRTLTGKIRVEANQKID